MTSCDRFNINTGHDAFERRRNSESCWRVEGGGGAAERAADIIAGEEGAEIIEAEKDEGRPGAGRGRPAPGGGLRALSAAEKTLLQVPGGEGQYVLLGASCGGEVT